MNRIFIFVIPFAISFIAYLNTVCPTLYTGDSGELSAATYTLGIAHPPGYPLLMILGRFFIIISPLHTALTLNILSSLLSSISAGIMALLIHSIFVMEKHKEGPWSGIKSAGGGLLFGFSNGLWSSAAGFEVYSLGILLILMTLFFLWKYVYLKNFSFMILAAYIFGLSMANHLSALSVAPILIYFVIRSGPGFKRTALLFFFFVLALSVYFYLPIRSALNPLFDWNHPSTLASFIDHVTARRYQAYISGFGFENFIPNVLRSLDILLNQFPLYLSIWGLAGLVIPGALRKDMRFILLSILAFNLFLSGLYDIPDIDLYYLPSVLVLTMGLLAFWNFIFDRFRGKLKYAGAAIIMLLIAVASFFRNYSINDQSDNRLAYIYGENILKSTPENSYLISVGDNSNSSLYYLRYVEGRRADLEIYDPVILVERLRRRLKAADLKSDLSGPDLCLTLARSFPEKSFIVKEHMLARGNPFEYYRMNLYPHGLVYGFKEMEIDLSLWNEMTIPSYAALSRNLDFKGMTMLANLHLCRGEDLYKARERREGAAEYAIARKITEFSREASVHNSLGIFFRHEGWPVLARNEYESALSAKHITADERSNIFVNLGNLEKDSGKYDKAIEYYLKALEINDENDEAEYNLLLARAYSDMKKMDYRSAAENFEKALNLPDPDRRINFNLGVIYDKNLNDRARAVYYYKKFIELYPDSEQAEAVAERIKQLEINRED